jgi:8-oxo-dGTP pyrophosphatase MutT (NUDIX family)
VLRLLKGGPGDEAYTTGFRTSLASRRTLGRILAMTESGDGIPLWLRELGVAAEAMAVPGPLVPPAVGGTRAAVLVLVGDGPGGPDLLFIQRSENLRLHSGEAAFPGGVLDDLRSEGPVAAALREASEEVGIRTCEVEVVACLPELYIPPTDFRVVPVLAWWRHPRVLRPSGSGEVTLVERIGLDELADPEVRLMLHRPQGIVLPAFHLRGRLVWGMTGAVVDQLLSLARRELPWDTTVVAWP